MEPVFGPVIGSWDYVDYIQGDRQFLLETGCSYTRKSSCIVVLLPPDLDLSNGLPTSISSFERVHWDYDDHGHFSVNDMTVFASEHLEGRMSLEDVHIYGDDRTYTGEVLFFEKVTYDLFISMRRPLCDASIEYYNEILEEHGATITLPFDISDEKVKTIAHFTIMQLVFDW